MKSISNIKPCVLHNIAAGKWHYNYNITEVEKDEEISYECEQIEVTGEPTYEKLVSAIIREKYTESAELSIVNKYNAHILKITINTDAVEQYRQLLLFVASVKEMVKTDLQITN
jgi:hypothetical protein